VPKPVEPAELLTVVASLTGRGRKRRSDARGADPGVSTKPSQLG
jgi:hypothetical protein